MISKDRQKQRQHKKLFRIEKSYKNPRIIPKDKATSLSSIKKVMFLNMKRKNLSSQIVKSKEIPYNSSVMLLYDKEMTRSIKINESYIKMNKKLSIETIETDNKFKINTSNMYLYYHKSLNDQKSFNDQSQVSYHDEISSFINKNSLDISSCLSSIGTYYYDIFEKYLIDYIFNNKKQATENKAFNYSFSYSVQAYLSENLKKLKSEDQFKEFLNAYFNQNSNLNMNVFSNLIFLNNFRTSLLKGLKKLNSDNMAINDFQGNNEKKERRILSSTDTIENIESASGMRNDMINMRNVDYIEILNDLDQIVDAFYNIHFSYACIETKRIIDNDSESIEKEKENQVNEKEEFLHEVSIIKFQIGVFEQLSIYLKYLVELDLTHFNICEESFKYIFYGLKFSNNLTDLNLSHNNLASEGSFELGKLLSETRTLQRLDVSYCHLNDFSITSLVVGMKGKINKSLVKLNMSHNSKITVKSRYNLIKFISELEYLEVLNISSIEFDYMIFDGLNSLLLSKEISIGRLKKLVAIKVGFTEECLLNFAGLLVNDKKNVYFNRLETLVLSNNSLNIPNFFKTISKNESLKEIIIGNCKLNDDVTYGIISIILNCKLKSISLYQNSFSKNSILSFMILFIDEKDIYKTEIDTSTTFLSEKEKEKEKNKKEFDDRKTEINILNKINILYNSSLIINNDDESFGNIPSNNISINLNENPEKHVNSNIFMNHIQNLDKKQRISTVEKLDVSKNKCFFLLSEELFVLLKNLKIKNIDISGNFNEDTSCEKGLFSRISTLTKIRNKNHEMKIYI